MSNRIRSTHADIKLSNLSHNYKILKSHLQSGQFICPMVKANAYGHGDIEVSKTLADLGADYLGVALVEEGIRLREAGLSTPILVFGLLDSVGCEAAVKFNLTPVLSQWDQIKSLENFVSINERFPVHIKFNTGMHRLGFAAEEARALKDFFLEDHHFFLQGICTHLLNSEDTGVEGGRTEEQLRLFQEIQKHFPKTAHHLMNSAAILADLDKKGGARPGISLYGALPALQKKIKCDLLPVMQVKSTVELVQKVKKGKTVSYGGEWKAPKDSIIGIVPIGYADGYRRALSNKGEMICKGQRVPVRGIVCMDYTLIDLTEVQGEVSVGEEVVVFGQQKNEIIKVEEVAKLAGTISYEILTGVSARVPRLYSHERI